MDPIYEAYITAWHDYNGNSPISTYNSVHISKRFFLKLKSKLKWPTDFQSISDILDTLSVSNKNEYISALENQGYIIHTNNGLYKLSGKVPSF